MTHWTQGHPSSVYQTRVAVCNYIYRFLDVRWQCFSNRLGVSIVSTAELSNAVCKLPSCLTRIMPVLSLSKTCYMFHNACTFLNVWSHCLAKRTQISMRSKSWVPSLFGRMSQPLLWSGLRVTSVKITSHVSSLLSYDAICILRILYKFGSRQRVGHTWPKTRGQPRRIIIRLLFGQSENNGSNPARGRELWPLPVELKPESAFVSVGTAGCFQRDETEGKRS
jgi:hypothetical protein